MRYPILISLIQTLGILIPLIGILGLLTRRKEQASPTLLLTNVGCFILNVGVMFQSRAESPEIARMSLNISSLGSVLFYGAFILFILNYLELRRVQLLVIPWLLFDFFVLFAIWFGDSRQFVFHELDFERNEQLGIMSQRVSGGMLYMVRYSTVTLILAALLIYTMAAMFKTPKSRRRNNLARIAGAEFVIVAAMNFTLLLKPGYDISPFFSSLSLLSIVFGVVKGELFTVIDSGKQWLIENIQSLFIIVDSNYCYKDANAYAQHVFPELRRLNRNKPIPDNIRELFTSTNTQFEIGERHYERSIREIRENGLIQGYGLLMVNVTEQYRLRKEAEAAKEAAEAANEAKSAFISNMSHEIRTPMNAIVGMTDILLREETKPDLREYLENIKSSGDALLSIINDILDISKIESGKMEIIEEEYEPMSLLSDLSMIFLNRIGDKPVELFYDVDPKLPSVLYGDAKRIRQILINIANNAIKFTEKGFVKVSVQVETKTASEEEAVAASEDPELSLRFSIQDTGQGIREEDLPKLFGTFSQVDTRKNHEKEGSGLGLSISKNLVELMGGKIGVESVYGEGSRFWFTLPQRIVKDTPAAALKASYLDGSEEKPVLCSAFSDERIEEQFQQLVSCYGIETVDIGDVLLGDARADFVFTDCVSDVCAISDEIISFLKEARTALYILRNPMLEGKVELRGTVLNKPLYTLNFCNAINHEPNGSRTETEHDFLFTAPSARILLVDDTEMNLKVAIGLLEPLGMTIETAENGKRAVEKVSKNSYDLVFMDHMMPVMDGIEATSAIRQMGGDYERLPIIALTANATTEAQKLFEENGLNDFVAKPIKMKEICKCLAKWLPAEKISKQEEMQPEAAMPQEKETALPSIEGIDSEAGIENSGSEQLWRSLLSDFYKLIDRKSTTIEKYLEDGMLRDYTIEVHALKNTARMVGALSLSEKFYQLEQLGNQEKEEEIKRLSPGVIKELRALKEKLRPYAYIEKSGPELTNEELREALSGLRDAMEEFDLDTADECMKKIEGGVPPEELRDRLEELSSFVADVAMEDVIRICDELLAKL